MLQDDSHLNRKIVRRIIEGSKDEFPQVSIVEADDGTTAVEELKERMIEGDSFDFVLMDFVMVSNRLLV